MLWGFLHLHLESAAEEVRLVFVWGALGSFFGKKFNEGEPPASTLLITDDSYIQNLATVLEELIKMPFFGIPVEVSNIDWSGPSWEVIVSTLLHIQFMSIDFNSVF